MRSRVHFAMVGMLLSCMIAMPARAATITVTNTNDSGSGSLRQALADAADGDTITFAVTGTITLTSGGLLVTKNLTISGPGADQLSIDCNQALLGLGVFPDKTATISGLTVRNGQAGIWNEGTLTLSNSVLTGNSADGLYNYGGTVSASSCVLSGNSYDGLYAYESVSTLSNCVVSGNAYGGLFNDVHFGPNDPVAGSGSMTIADSIISDNLGPGVFNYSFVTILNSTLSGNSAGQFVDGGGISNGTFKAPASVTLIDSTISGNSASGGGGGIANYYWGVTIVNSTISGNSAQGGGGIENVQGGVQIANSTVSGNSADSGSGIENVGDQFGATIQTGNTIFNAGASGENIVNEGGTVTSDGYNVCSDDGGGFLNGPGDQIDTDPLLGPLQDNGGPTLTHLPLPGSPAIDAGDPNFTPPPLRDQRGVCFHRKFGRRIDVGSVEIQPEPRCPTPAPRPTPH